MKHSPSTGARACNTHIHMPVAWCSSRALANCNGTQGKPDSVVAPLAVRLFVCSFVDCGFVRVVCECV